MQPQVRLYTTPAVFSFTDRPDATDFEAAYGRGCSSAKAQIRHYRAHMLKYYGFWVVTVLD